jgi:transposase
MPQKPKKKVNSDRRTRIAQAVALRLQGQQVEDIAATLGVNRSTASEYLNSPEGRALLGKSREDALHAARAKVDQHLVAAVDRLVELLDCEKQETARKAACDLLRLAGWEGGGQVPEGLDVSTAAGLKASLEALARGVLRGDVPGGVSSSLVSLAALAGRLLELETFEERLAKLEQALGVEKNENPVRAAVEPSGRTG